MKTEQELYEKKESILKDIQHFRDLRNQAHNEIVRDAWIRDIDRNKVRLELIEWVLK